MRVLVAIADYWREQRYPPYIRDLARMVDVGTTTVNYHIERLLDAGYIVNRPRLARSIVITDRGWEYVQSLEL